MLPKKAALQCNSMAELRAEIDVLDNALIDMLALRTQYIDRAVALKQKEGLPANIPARVDEVLGNVEEKARVAGFDPELARKLWSELIAWSIKREEKHLGETKNGG